PVSGRDYGGDATKYGDAADRHCRAHQIGTTGPNGRGEFGESHCIPERGAHLQVAVAAGPVSYVGAAAKCHGANPPILGKKRTARGASGDSPGRVRPREEQRAARSRGDGRAAGTRGGDGCEVLERGAEETGSNLSGRSD